MKTLLITLFFIFSAVPAFACKPYYPKCENPTVIIQMKDFTFLQTMVDKYQEYLTTHMTRPDQVSSCFNHGFASYFLGMAETDLKKGKKICESHRHSIVNGIKGLISTDSDEFKAVKSEEARSHLIEQGKKIAKQLEVTFPNQ